MADQGEESQLDRIERMLGEIHAELQAFAPVLAVFKPGNGASDLQRAGMVRMLMKGARK